LYLRTYSCTCFFDEVGILDEVYFQDVDWLFERLGLTWNDYSAVDELDDKGRFPHEAVLKLSQAIETNPVPRDVSARELLIKRREELLTMLRLYAEWYGHPHPARATGRWGCPCRVKSTLARLTAPVLHGRLDHAAALAVMECPATATKCC
jgi:hypothetical protein